MPIRTVRTLWIGSLLVAAIGCGDDGGTIDRTIDARTDAMVDAGVDVAESDGGPDAAIDASDPDAGDLDAADPDAADPDAGDLDAADIDAADIDAVPIDAPTDARIDGMPGPVRVRIVTSNLTSGNFQAYEAPGSRLLDGLDPDVVLMQEFNVGGNTPAELRGFVDATFGPQFGYAREPGAQIPNGVITRFPIVDSGVWDDPRVANREFVWARLDVPGPQDLWAVSVHLLTASAGERNLEAVALRGFIAANVPTADLLVIGGDFNTASRGEAALTTLAEVVSVAAPHPSDQSANDNTNATRTKPYDWVLADADLRALQTPVVIGASTFPAGMVLDTRVYMPLIEVSPAQLGDSAAPSMQHMAVVKDFILIE